MNEPVSHSWPDRERTRMTALDRAALGFLRHWLLIFNLCFGVFVAAPWLAPVFMQTGHPGAAQIVYWVYSTQCHQLPQRSFFLFGQQAMYSLADIQAAWRDTNNPYILRQFIGNPQLGWKVAWSDRMVSMYTSLFIAGMLYGLIRKRVKPLSLMAFVLLAILPMLIDGGTHMVSDLAGLGNGFRDNNAWLVWLTGNTLPPAFYAGEALGSFNSWMRLMTGVLFGVGVVWLAYPYLERATREAADALEAKLRRAGAMA